MEGRLGEPSLSAGAKEQAGKLAGQAKEAALHRAEAKKGDIVGRIEELAGTLEEVSSMLSSKGIPGDFIQRAASVARQASTQIQGKSAEELWQMAQREVRQRPAVWVAGCAVLGFLAGRLVRNERDMHHSEPSFQGGAYAGIGPSYGTPSTYGSEVGNGSFPSDL